MPNSVSSLTAAGESTERAAEALASSTRPFATAATVRADAATARELLLDGALPAPVPGWWLPGKTPAAGTGAPARMPAIKALTRETVASVRFSTWQLYDSRRSGDSDETSPIVHRWPDVTLRRGGQR